MAYSSCSYSRCGSRLSIDARWLCIHQPEPDFDANCLWRSCGFVLHGNHEIFWSAEEQEPPTKGDDCHILILTEPSNINQRHPVRGDIAYFFLLHQFSEDSF